MTSRKTTPGWPRKRRIRNKPRVGKQRAHKRFLRAPRLCDSTRQRSPVWANICLVTRSKCNAPGWKLGLHSRSFIYFPNEAATATSKWPTRPSLTLYVSSSRNRPGSPTTGLVPWRLNASWYLDLSRVYTYIYIYILMYVCNNNNNTIIIHHILVHYIIS